MIGFGYYANEATSGAEEAFDGLDGAAGVDEMNDKEKDVFLENEELKEEVAKLAAQVQYLKIVGMLADNIHVKPKRDGYFSKQTCAKHFGKAIAKVSQCITVMLRKIKKISLFRMSIMLKWR